MRQNDEVAKYALRSFLLLGIIISIGIAFYVVFFKFLYWKASIGFYLIAAVMSLFRGTIISDLHHYRKTIELLYVPLFLYLLFLNWVFEIDQSYWGNIILVSCTILLQGLLIKIIQAQE